MNIKIKKHFQRVDPVLYAVLEKLEVLPEVKVCPQDKYFLHLVDSIISQQLSGKAAATIFSRFKKLFIDEDITPERILKLADQTIRDVGISFGKISYLKDLATKILDGTVEVDKLAQMSDQEVTDHLIKVKGIGRWTAEMFLMFTLGREDVYSLGDLGLTNGIKKLYQIENPTKEQILKITDKWSPYRSFGSLVLWRCLDMPLVDKADIRQYKNSDRSQIINLWQGVLFKIFNDEPNINNGTVENIPTTYGKNFLVAEVDNKVIGTVAFILEENHARLKRMYVDTKFQGSGIAQELYEQIEKLIKGSGIHKIILSTYPQMKRAVSFYKKNGFKEFKKDNEQIYMSKNIYIKRA